MLNPDTTLISEYERPWSQALFAVLWLSQNSCEMDRNSFPLPFVLTLGLPISGHRWMETFSIAASEESVKSPLSSLPSFLQLTKIYRWLLDFFDAFLSKAPVYHTVPRWPTSQIRRQKTMTRRSTGGI